MVEFKDVVRASLAALERGDSVALASIVRVRGSSPRHIGARMLVWPDGRMVGTIGGGTLEWRVVEHAQAALAERRPRFANYVFDTRGGPDSVGLCGGSVDVHIDVDLQEFADVAQTSLQALEQGETVAIASVVREGDAAPQHARTRMVIWPDGRTYGTLGGGGLEDQVRKDAQEALAERKPRYVSYAPDGADGSGVAPESRFADYARDRRAQADPQGVVVHLDVLRPDPTLLIIGAGHVAQPVATIGHMLGMRVCVVDDREEWANRERFPTAAEIAVVGYEPVNEILDPIPFPMTPATYMVITTWGYDLPAMEQALRHNPAYIGLVASPTKAKVLFQRLREAGFPDDDIRRIRAPVGLDLGAESPAEIAVSILGEILAVARAKSGRPLQDVRGERVYAMFAGSEPVVAPAPVS